MFEIDCRTAEDTLALGARLASSLRPGDILVLVGELGAGKTLLTGGIAAGLGVEEVVTSPSFVLVRVYDTGFIPLVHVDVYRLNSLNEFEDLDLLDTSQEAVLVIEWGGVVESVLPKDHLRIEMLVADDETRTLRFVGEGSWSDRDLGSMQ